MAKARRNYTGNAISTTTSSSIAASGTTSFTVASATGWPYGSAPFFIVLEPGSAAEEKVLVTRSGSTDTTIAFYDTPNVAANRGLDGTSAVSHSSGSTVYPVFTATDADEANELASTLTTKGDLLTHGTSTFARVAVGTNNHVLVADSAQTAGIKWGQIQTAGIADDAVTAAKIAAGAVGASEIADGTVGTSELTDDAVTSAKIANNAVGTTEIADDAVTTAKIANSAVTTAKIGDSQVTAAKIAAGVIPVGVPTGSITQYAGSSAPSGWLLCDGAAVSRTTYADLFTVTSTTYGGGNGTTTFNVPNLKGRVPVGLDSAQTEFDALAETGGAKTHTLTSAQMPQHAHGPGADIDGRATNYIIQGQSQSAAEGWGLSATATIGARAATSTGLTGGSAAHNNLQPYLVVNYIIKT